MGRTANSETELPQLDEVEEMPKPIRGFRGGRSQHVQELVNLVNDVDPETGEGKAHIIKNANADNKATWSRKIRYAAKLADKEVEIVYVPEQNDSGKVPGIYFKGYEKGAAPKRGLRR